MSTEIAKFNDETVKAVISKINTYSEAGELKLPANYSPENAVRAAFLSLQEGDILTTCTVNSIGRSMMRMVTEGLSIVKGQCAFIKRGNVCTYQREYPGTIALAKRVSDVKDVRGVAVYKDDLFEFEKDIISGWDRILKHTQTMDSIDPDNVIGAYAIVEFNDGSVKNKVMNMKQIRKSWEMGSARGNSPAHKNFADEMAVKTVINRALKIKINSSDDASLFGDNEDTNQVKDSVDQEISDLGNKEVLVFDVTHEEVEIIEPDPHILSKEEHNKIEAFMNQGSVQDFKKEVLSKMADDPNPELYKEEVQAAQKDLGEEKKPRRTWSI